MSTPRGPGAPFSEVELAAWHGMLRLHAQVFRQLDAALMEAHRLSVREFDVLITLANAPDRQLRMSNLAGRVMLSPSGLTRLVERLERERLVSRSPDADDARSFRAKLTNLGQRRLDEARTTHNRVVRWAFLRQLTPDEQRQLGRVWAKVLPPEPQ